MFEYKNIVVFGNLCLLAFEVQLVLVDMHQ